VLGELGQKELRVFVVFYFRAEFQQALALLVGCSYQAANRRLDYGDSLVITGVWLAGVRWVY
jgi:hypothetical protein